jgi:hypothetical protein
MAEVAHCWVSHWQQASVSGQLQLSSFIQGIHGLLPGQDHIFLCQVLNIIRGGWDGFPDLHKAFSELLANSVLKELLPLGNAG